MELALNQGYLDPQRIADWPAWLGLIVSKLTRNTPLAARKLMLLIEYGAVEFGAVLLAATDLDDLDGKLDAMIEDPNLQHLTNLIVRSRQGGVLQVAATDPAERLISLLGEGQASLIREGVKVSLAIAQIHRQAKASADGPAAHLPAAAQQEPLAFLTDPAVPGAVARALLGGAKAYACMFALCQVLLTEERPQPWLARAIVERWTTGEREYLRLLASMPGNAVDPSLVPTAERLDLDQLYARTAQRARRIRELKEAAKASGLAVYPPIQEAEEE